MSGRPATCSHFPATTTNHFSATTTSHLSDFSDLPTNEDQPSEFPAHQFEVCNQLDYGMSDVLDIPLPNGAINACSIVCDAYEGAQPAHFCLNDNLLLHSDEFNYASLKFASVAL